MRRTQPATAQLVALLDEAYDHRSWHGTNLRGSLRGLTARQAAWRPAPGRHSIAEIAIHAAYWKYVVRRKLVGDPRGSFPLAGSNWFPLDGSIDEREWKTHLALLAQQHRLLRGAVTRLSDDILEQQLGGGKLTRAAYIRGVAAHDLYHAGQVQTIKALWRSRAGGGS